MQTSLGLTAMGLIIIFVTVGILIRGRVMSIWGSWYRESA